MVDDVFLGIFRAVEPRLAVDREREGSREGRGGITKNFKSLQDERF